MGPGARHLTTSFLGRPPSRQSFVNHLRAAIASRISANSAIRMNLLVSRVYPSIDPESLVEYQARDTLLRMTDGRFLLHLSSTDRSVDANRLVWIDSRAALIWINATPDQFGVEWE